MIILSILVIIIAVMLFTNITLFSSYEKEEGFHLAIKFLFLSFKIYPQPQKKNKPNSLKKRLEDLKKELSEEKFSFLDGFQLFGSVISSVKHQFTINELEIKIKFGSKDAAETAIAVGALYSSIYGTLGAIQNLIFVKKPQIEVIPVYNEIIATGSFKGNVTAKVISLILIGLKLISRLNKIKNKNKKRTV